MNSLALQHSKFDLILCSQELKKTIKGRIDKLEVSLFKLCEQLGFKYEMVRLWMNITDPTNLNQRMKQWQVIVLAESLGIDIRITVVMKPLSTAYAIKYDPNQTSHGR
ncbi:MAG: hypothetical protein QQN63_13320 [Nitrosopumilus sp.]